MKQLLSLLLAAMVLSCACVLTACGDPGGSVPAPSDSDISAESSGASSEAPVVPIEPVDAGSVSGGITDTGVFSVLCPDGWRAFPAADIFGAYENGVDPTALDVYKGAAIEADMKKKPGMRIAFYGEEEEFSAPNTMFYTDLVTYEPTRIGNFVWNGFSGGNLGKQVIVLWTDDGKTRFQVSIWAEADDGTISLDDKDVRAIIESIAVTG